MSEQSDGRRADRGKNVIASVFVRNLTRRYEIALAEPDWLPVIGYLTCDPEIAGPAPEPRRLAIIRSGPFVQLQEPDTPPVNFAAINDVREHLHKRFFIESVAGDHPVLHAACLRYQDRRVLLAAPKTVGKSTLTLALALAGCSVEGDEHIFAMPEGVIARPRACRVKEGSFEILPQIAPLAASAPFTSDWQGRKIYNLPPDRLGQPWRIAAGRADIVIVMHSNHGGMSSIRPAAPMFVTHALVAEAVFPAKGKATGISNIVQITRNAASYDMSVGDLPAAVACVKSVLAPQ